MAPRFDDAFRERFRDLVAWRRDVRRFKPDHPLPDGMLETLIGFAALAPSVGLSQPWRFVVVDNPKRRQAIRQNFEACNAEALANLRGATARRYASLKLAGLDEAPCQLAVFSDRTTKQGHLLGRRTMPEMVEYSTVLAVHTTWLAARSYGIGMGWVSILEPASVCRILDVPNEWRFIGYFCLGYPREDADQPALEREGWERRRPPASFLLVR
jgi:5,6-dimethylbenzimidazole synthase